MRLTYIHAAYWQSKQPKPAWVVGCELKKDKVISIDHCINHHAYPLGLPGSTVAPNLCNLLTMHIRNHKRNPRTTPEDLLAFLDRLAVAPGCATRPERRAAFCKKWAARIRKNRVAA